MNQITGKIRAGKIAGSIGSGVDYYKGDKGEDGYTPIKGVDYFTQEDIQEIISQIDIPPSYDMATALDMSDWESGKVVDAGTLKFDFQSAIYQLNAKANTASLANVAFSGNYNELTNKPVIITESRVNELIDTKLGVIENGTY